MIKYCLVVQFWLPLKMVHKCDCTQEKESLNMIFQELMITEQAVKQASS